MVFYKLATDFINHHIYMAITNADLLIGTKKKHVFLDMCFAEMVAFYVVVNNSIVLL